MRLSTLRLPTALRARSGSSFDSRVERDEVKAKAKRKKARVTEKLVMLELSGGEGFADRTEAEAGLEAIWTGDTESDAGHNDLAVAYAWLERWDEALVEADAAVKGATATEQAATDEAKAGAAVTRQRAETNRRLIGEARREATG